MNFIYCLDKNYNTQAIMSFYSLNKVLKKPIKVFVAHNEPKTLIAKIKNFNFTYLEFHFLEISNNLNLPNLKNSHVTEATYYRMFAIDLLPVNLEHIIYIDSDILFNKNPIPLFSDLITSLHNSEFTISANTIGEYETGTEETKAYFDYLEMNDKYFNAGVLIYDLIKYNKNQTGQKLKDHLLNFTKEAKYWDQDILNTFFNGKYIELPETLNNNVITENDSIDMKETLSNTTIHFAGKTKPWHIKGLKYPVGIYFQEKYKEVFNRNFYIKPYDKRRHLRELIEFIKNNKDYKFDNKFIFLLKSTLELFKL